MYIPLVLTCLLLKKKCTHLPPHPTLPSIFRLTSKYIETNN